MREGGVTRAPGTIIRGNTRNNAKAKLMPFEFAEDDALTLEFTDGWLRVWRYGELVIANGAPYELATPYGEDVLDDLQWVQAADVIYITDGRQPIHKLKRFALNDWEIELAAYNAGPFRVQNLDEDQTIQCSAANGSITLTATGDIFDASWVGVLVQLKPVDYSDIPLWSGNTAISVDDLMRYDTAIYKLTAGSNTGINPPIHLEGERLVDKEKGTKWLFVSDSTGIVRVTAVDDANSASADVIKDIPDPCITSATYRWSEGAWSARWGYPKAVSIFDQSFLAGFTPTEPRTVWASTLGLFDDFEPSIEADGSFAYVISGSESQNSGRWLKPGKRGIYIGALGEVYRGYSNASGQRIGPTTFDTDLEAEDGCSKMLPIRPYGYPVFATKDSRRIQEIRYSFEEDGGAPIELSLPAQHLGAEGFYEAVWQSAPQRLAWFRRGNGELAAMLYDPSEEVLGWARYSLAGGEVESLSVTTDVNTGNDVLSLVVRREINGETVRMFEEQAQIFGIITGNRPIHEAVHFFASTIFASEVATGTFLVPDLIGENVFVWTEHGEYGPLLVPEGGEITIGFEVFHAVIGLLDETHHCETLNIPAQANDGSSIGRYRRLHAGGGLIVHRTAAGRVRSVERTFGEPVVISDPIDIVPLGVAADLSVAHSGVSKLDLPTGFADEVSYIFEPYGGAPMTISGLIPCIEEAAG